MIFHNSTESSRMRLLFFCATLFAATAAFASDRSVTDDAGREVVIPSHPERIVVMHEPLLGVPLMDLGINPVGSYGRSSDGKVLTIVDFIDTVLGSGHPKPKGFGAVGQIDLEKLRMLEPDLIIGTELDLDKVAQLSNVAPVYLQKVSTGKAHGFSVEAELAKVLGREDAFAKRRALYMERVAEIRKKMHPAPPGRKYLAIFLTDQINAVGEMSGAVQALQDLGYSPLELGQKGRIPGMGSTLLVPLSPEVFGQLNPDILVLMNRYTSHARDEATTRAVLSRIVPGWEKFLKPARDGRLLFLDSAEVTTPTVASALKTLDAFENWLDR